MDKKEYIMNQLKKTYNKKYENYCITRIYHLLNRQDIQIITQQLFKRDDGKIALADLYFPQFNLIVEVDEWQHKKDYHIIDDKKRTNEIIKNKLKALDEVICHKLYFKRIDATKSIEDINKRIDEIVNIIKTEIDKQDSKFIPWEINYKPPEYYIKQGYIDFKNNVRFRTIKEISDLFNKGYKKGVRKDYFNTIVPNEYIWCCKLRLNNDDGCKNIPYINEITIDGKNIYETSKENCQEFASSVLENPKQTRITFAKYRDSSGDIMYKYRGVFKLDAKKTESSIKNGEYKRIWKKVEDRVELGKYFK